MTEDLGAPITADEIAEAFHVAINNYMTTTERSLQAADVKIGVSDLGFCSERLRRQLDGQTKPDPEEWLKAFIGTAVGDYVEKAIKVIWPHALIQSEVMIELEGEQRIYQLPGHPDVVLTDEKIVLDIKVPGGFDWIRRKDISQNYQWQRNLYAIAAWRAGWFGKCDLSEVRVGNVFIDRSGENPIPYVQVEPVDENVLFEASSWLDEVVYAYIHEEEARKEPPREMCAKVCGFYSICRALDTDVEGRIDHPDTIEAVQMYVEGAELERTGKRMKNKAKVRLNGVQGSTGDYTIRWTTVNGGQRNYVQEAYQKIDIKPIRR